MIIQFQVVAEVKQKMVGISDWISSHVLSPNKSEHSSRISRPLTPRHTTEPTEKRNSSNSPRSISPESHSKQTTEPPVEKIDN